MAPCVPVKMKDEATKNLDDLINNMRETVDNPGLRQICESDELIREFGRSLIGRLGSEDEQRLKDKDNIRTKMRYVARLMKHLNEDKPHKPLTYYITGKQFHTVANGVKSLAMKTQSTSLATALGHYIRQIALLKRSLAIEQDDDQSIKEAKNFQAMFDAHWRNSVSSVALRRARLRQMNRKIVMPHTDDLVTLKTYLQKKILEDIQDENPTYEHWLNMAKNTLVRIAIYNKRRIAEVEEMKVRDVEELSTSRDNTEILGSLDVSEKALAER